MSKKKLTTAIASAALAASFIVAPVAPANAGPSLMAPQGPRHAVCHYFPFFC
ncbi:hypothetical protein RCG67_03770 [Kocuria sp. CPCC 205292]|uniref:hypothetical protein n=1 Tax=Kocuria cellulosilytica TaxID=3071451 RepID=UPI0034D47CCB